MKRAAVATCLPFALIAPVHAKPSPSRPLPRLPPPPAHVWVRPAPPLPMLPSVGRVRVEVARDRVVVIEEVNLPRGDWQSGGLDLYVAFGAPGTPVAIDAHLVAVPPGTLEARSEDAGPAIAIERAVRRSPSAQMLLGPPQMAGFVLHVSEGDLRRAYATGDVAAIRVRSVLASPSADAKGARDVVVRLGIAGGLPLTLGRVQVVSLEAQPWLIHAEASLCGPEADSRPLAVATVPKTTSTAFPTFAPVAPSMAVRHAGDDLCVRWWASG